MRVLVLWADHTSTNLGLRALASGTAALVRQVWPDSEVTFYNYGSRVPQLPIGSVRALIRERITRSRGAVGWLGEFDLAVDTRSGDSFSDIYGLRRLTVMSQVADLVAQAAVPLVLGPQTIGPFRTRTSRLLARRALRQADIVMARDSASARCSAKFGRPVDVRSSDVVFALERPVIEVRRDVLLNVSGLLWHNNSHVDAARYRRTVAGLHRALVDSGRSVTLLAHVLNSTEPDNDVPALREFAAEFPESVEVLVPTSLEDARTIVAGASLVIGSRMHACLNALSCGVPTIPLAYSRKFAGLLGDLGWSSVVDLRTAADPVGEVARLAAEPGLGAAAVEAGDRARASLTAAADALRGMVLVGAHEEL